jgi:hypothetical protein
VTAPENIIQRVEANPRYWPAYEYALYQWLRVNNADYAPSEVGQVLYDRFPDVGFQVLSGISQMAFEGAREVTVERFVGSLEEEWGTHA